jgi:hypothetical protein
MTKRKRRPEPPIHPSIKERLGYNASDTDDEVYEDWKERTTRVCKPCWELKYCPYGPLVEQLPLLPSLQSDVEEQQAYFKKCLETNTVGTVTVLTNAYREMYEEWLADEELLRHQALNQLRNQKRFEHLEKLETEEEQLAAWLGGELPPVHIYRVPYDLGLANELDEADFAPEIWREILRLAEVQRTKLTEALRTGKMDNRSPLESVRRAWFQKQIDNFSANAYREHPSSFH